MLNSGIRFYIKQLTYNFNYLKFKTNTLNGLSYFNDIFEPKLLEEIEKHSVFRKIDAGEIIIETGQIVKYIPVLIHGSVKVFREDDTGKELLIYYINPGEGCALTFTCCMQENPSEVRAAAEEDAELLLIPAGKMDEWMGKYPTWKTFVLKTIRTRFKELLQTIDQIAFKNLDERLLRYLIDKSKSNGSRILNLSHQQIADDLATSRVVVSRLLKKLENDKKLLLFRNQIKILIEM